MTDELARLTVVANELEAEMVRALLTTHGIDSMQRYTNVAAGAFEGSFSSGGPREILVRVADVERARELIDSD